MCSPPLGHFDEVSILETPTTQELEIDGGEGIVVGISEEQGERYYAVAIEGLGRTVMLGAKDVRATGRRAPREEIYDGSGLRVSKQGHVAPDAGELGK